MVISSEEKMEITGIAILNSNCCASVLPYCTVRLVQRNYQDNRQDEIIEEKCADHQGKFTFTIKNPETFRGLIEFEYENVQAGNIYLFPRIKHHLGNIYLRPEIAPIKCENHHLESLTCNYCGGKGFFPVHRGTKCLWLM